MAAALARRLQPSRAFMIETNCSILELRPILWMRREFEALRSQQTRWGTPKRSKGR